MSELLAPAGNLEKLKIAVLYGADAVYLAGPKYSLRAGTDNFSDVEMIEGLAFAKKHGAKIYVTLNAFLHDSDLDGLPEYVKFLEASGVNAVIISDLGVLTLVRQHSNIPIHVSTQASCLSTYSAKFWKAQGAKRIVLGRETSVAEASEIEKEADVEVEMFVHGAMCMAYSGNCTISNYTLGRDSNRGGCSQSCRFGYDFWSSNEDALANKKPMVEDHSFMSSKDLRGVERIPEFLDKEITSLKIEGRMKSNLYVATTVQSYANALRTSQSKTSPDLKSAAVALEKIPHRQYTEAALMGPADSNSVYIHSDRSGKHNSNYELAGTVIETVEGKHLVMTVQNPFKPEDHLEVLTFDGQIIPIPAQSLKDVAQNSIEFARPNHLVSLPHFENIEPLNLVRRLVA